jgi:hypothetical protein
MAHEEESEMAIKGTFGQRTEKADEKVAEEY